MFSKSINTAKQLQLTRNEKKKTRTVHWETYLRKKHFSFSFPWYLAIDGKIILHDNLTHQIQKYIAYINEQ